jgi:NAD(P)-dependent dehydrogenase (short-subunit alcohol dehydrogenase family)
MITIVSGGTQGLGEAVARRLAATGFTTGMVLVGRSAQRGQALAAALTSAGVDTMFVAADVSDAATPQSVVSATLFEDTPEHVDSQMNMNVKAPYFMIQAVARELVAQGSGGSIVNVGSTSGHGGQPKLTAYCMSKAALTVMTKNLAFGLMRHGIRINQVNPGWMETESEHRTQVEQDGAPENWLELAASSRPLGRLVQPGEVANAIAYCLSPDAGLMTGNCIDLDQSVQGAGDPPLPGLSDTIHPTP